MTCTHEHIRVAHRELTYSKDERWICVECGAKWFKDPRTIKPKRNTSATRKIKTLSTKIAKLYEQIHTIQSECKHLDATYVYKGSTGNYDPGADSYWIEITCNDCNKRWNEDQ